MYLSLNLIYLCNQIPVASYLPLIPSCFLSSLAGLRGRGWCRSICLWNATQRKRCTAPTPHSTAPACPTAVTTVASSSTQSPPGLHRREVAAPPKPPATSPSSSTRHPQHHPRASSKQPAARAAHLLGLLPQGATKCPRSLLDTPRTPWPGRTPHIPKARLFPWPCLHHLYLPLTITRTCTWAPPPVRKREALGR